MVDQSASNVIIKAIVVKMMAAIDSAKCSIKSMATKNG